MAEKLPDSIENDEQFNAVCARMVKGAELIEDCDPLDDEKLQKLWTVYNRMDELTTEYQEREGRKWRAKLRIPQM